MKPPPSSRRLPALRRAALPVSRLQAVRAKHSRPPPASTAPTAGRSRASAASRPPATEGRAAASAPSMATPRSPRWTAGSTAVEMSPGKRPPVAMSPTVSSPSTLGSPSTVRPAPMMPPMTGISPVSPSNRLAQGTHKPTSTAPLSTTTKRGWRNTRNGGNVSRASRKRLGRRGVGGFPHTADEEHIGAEWPSPALYRLWSVVGDVACTFPSERPRAFPRHSCTSPSATTRLAPSSRRLRAPRQAASPLRACRPFARSVRAPLARSALTAGRCHPAAGRSRSVAP